MQMIFLQMGFEEMPTNNYVESSSFWNFDALFQPQQHPARDSHDAYFLKECRINLDVSGSGHGYGSEMELLGSNGLHNFS
ncbi:phenylalanine--tRNA ligase alpha subunit, cytoplasmic-like [Helianthus annuus]|uniref:phenylalanine--tRNA ligase alpha subunit, cytoplasmic-like n=1 Tax=Helianthus annuus TaxID=4232 RepID=UPI000B905C9E|nr:phenylalanine--tRNA ligase alpha subunit, cytoplasmic-like [Helianthus annuus]XP_035837413.1 phenylalanine--tRNA ligase alpha subunit, cytoplasmic-like [Helianthus annuus]